MIKDKTAVPETPNEPKTRKAKRSPLELLAAQKQDYIDRVLRAHKKITDATAELEKAKKEEAAFISSIQSVATKDTGL